MSWWLKRQQVGRNSQLRALVYPDPRPPMTVHPFFLFDKQQQTPHHQLHPNTQVLRRGLKPVPGRGTLILTQLLRVLPLSTNSLVIKITTTAPVTAREVACAQLLGS